MSTALAIAGLIAVAAIHLGQVLPTVRQTPLLGTSFILLVMTCVGLAGCLLVSERREVWLLIATVNALTIAGYVLTRSVSSFLDNQDVGNWDETIGVVALLVEGVLILLSFESLYGNRLRRLGSVDVRVGEPTPAGSSIRTSQSFGPPR